MPDGNPHLHLFLPLTTPEPETAEGGLAILLTNKTGQATVKGMLLEAGSGADTLVTLVAEDDFDPIGVCHEAGIADGSDCWVVVSGIAEVYFELGATRHDFFRAPNSGAGGDGLNTGNAVAEAVPGSPAATDKHFQEAGHVLETVAADNLAKCVLHFN